MQRGSVSSSVAVAAPREQASKPRAPLPANKSSTCVPRMCGASQLNSVSRTRSGVGRMAATWGKRKRRPRQIPAMMRTSLAGALRVVAICGAG